MEGHVQITSPQYHIQIQFIPIYGHYSEPFVSLSWTRRSKSFVCLVSGRTNIILWSISFVSGTRNSILRLCTNVFTPNWSLLISSCSEHPERSFVIETRRSCATRCTRKVKYGSIRVTLWAVPTNRKKLSFREQTGEWVNPIQNKSSSVCLQIMDCLPFASGRISNKRWLNWKQNGCVAVTNENRHPD
jgi:hypothetical protein